MPQHFQLIKIYACSLVGSISDAIWRILDSGTVATYRNILEG